MGTLRNQDCKAREISEVNVVDLRNAIEHLNEHRRRPFRARSGLLGHIHYQHPDVGLWWNWKPWYEGGNDDDVQCCGVCGGEQERLVLDHCHVTGWERGYVCFSCNSEEGRSDDEPGTMWWLWRRTAPRIGLRLTYHSGAVTGRSWDSMLTDQHLAEGLSIDELLSLNETLDIPPVRTRTKGTPKPVRNSLLPYWDKEYRKYGIPVSEEDYFRISTSGAEAPRRGSYMETLNFNGIGLQVWSFSGQTFKGQPSEHVAWCTKDHRVAK